MNSNHEYVQTAECYPASDRPRNACRKCGKTKEWHEQLPKKKIAYLASPYTHSDESIRIKRFQYVSSAVAIFMEMNEYVYSPIAMTHTASTQHSLPKDYLFWHDFNCAFIDRFDELWILCLDGWKESKGTKAEIEYAKAKNMPIRYWDFNGYNLIEVIF